MREQIIAELEESALLKQWLAENLSAGIAQAIEAILETYRGGGKVLLCGNGGSAADSQHLAAELLGRFRQERTPLAAIALSTDTSILTAVSNDTGFEHVFARQVEALIAPHDVLIAISTSGNSPNVLRAVEMAKMRRAKTVGLTGADGGELARLVDIAVRVPSEDTPRIQEAHIAIGHIICEMVEKELFGTGAR